ncbi:ATP-dependent DNA ligase [Nakamurella deserti]|uniref:ATP-dependent DNA ligase n=1 Tax=Nakamurella deserti TaxID=2164074 RepID=UPI000DBE3937|nr:ATP-dependent DNA ligase [Nakamurella deserti]
MLFDALVTTSAAVAGTRSRLAKRDALAALLAAAGPEDVDIIVSYLGGELRQRRTGIGHATLRTLPPPAAEPSLTVAAVDAALEHVAGLAGPGSAAARTAAVGDLFARATADEQDFLRRLVAGEIRQGALDSTVLDAVALASGIPLASIRRAVMMAGATGPVAVAALTGGEPAVAAFTLRVGVPLRPMLASSAPDVRAAMTKLGDGLEVCLDTKLDGIRIQAHRDGDRVRLFTRSLDDITNRLPEVAAIVASLPTDRVVLDGEVIALDANGRPRPFQETASRTATQGDGGTVALSVFFFDCLVWDGRELIDRPLSERLEVLGAAVPAAHLIDRLVTADPAAADAFFAGALAAGQEGVVVKDLAAPYEAGRRGSGWIKVKPRHTLDLVVLAVERGSGRRQGLLSNIHLGARDPDRPGEFVMLGKTFKGMTDAMLAWQTERFTELAVERSDWVVRLRPEQVVEIAFDGVQRSSRYPGGFALRFARVLRYRDDKTADEADTVDAVRALASWFEARGAGGADEDAGD